MFGNFIGDGVKGSDLQKFPDEIARGVRFHRFIDTYTDTHAEVSEIKKRFYPTQAKFSGVVVDVLFDHMLALKWEEYHETSLGQFAEDCHRVIDRFAQHLPFRSERFYHYMVAESILSNYAKEQGISKVFQGMDGRTGYVSNMSSAMQDAREHWDELSASFDRFFPDLIKACSTWKTEH